LLVTQPSNSIDSRFDLGHRQPSSDIVGKPIHAVGYWELKVDVTFLSISVSLLNRKGKYFLVVRLIYYNYMYIYYARLRV